MIGWILAISCIFGTPSMLALIPWLGDYTHEWADNHNVTDTSWKENFYNMDVFEWIKLFEEPKDLKEFLE